MHNVSAFLFSLLAWISGFSIPAHAQRANVPAQTSLGENPATDVSPALVDSFVSRARELKLAERKEWLRLVHYKPGLFGAQSQADGANFFVSPAGKKNATAELEATLRGFFSLEKRKLDGQKQPPQSVRCQFPARFEWLDRELQLSASVPQQACPEWDEFRARMAVKSVTLVFSSFYVGNPSSTFGHSLVRLNKSDGADGSEHHQLLDYGVNYAAEATTENPMLYAFFGLAGLFKGTFTSLPYYYKVREYADFQSRDVWEYDLDLTPQEVERFIAHIWELGSTYFDYFYLTENCSYHMLTLIETAAPRVSLVDKVPFWVIPTDTVKAAFEEEGLVRKTSFRPSIHTQFLARLDRLQGDEEDSLRTIIAREGDDGSADDQNLLAETPLDETAKARVLDAYIDYVDLNHARELVEKEPTMVKRKQSLLIARSRLPVSEPLSFDPPPASSPHLAHDSARASLSHVANDRKGDAISLGMRFAFHDLLDPSEGLPDNADIEFFNPTFRYWQRTSRLQLEDFAFFGVGTFQPLDAYTKKFSWRARTGFHRVDDLRCQDCTSLFFEGGAGFSARIGRSPICSAKPSSIPRRCSRAKDSRISWDRRSVYASRRNRG